MTKDETIKLAKEYGSIMPPYDYGAQPYSMIITFDNLEKLAKHFANLEREACANLLESSVDSVNVVGEFAVLDMAKAIRARKLL